MVQLVPLRSMFQKAGISTKRNKRLDNENVFIYSVHILKKAIDSFKLK